MKILVIGTGYVGTTTALVFAEMGWKVTGLDKDKHKVISLRKGTLHFFEYGLEELLLKHLSAGNIKFTSNTEKAIEDNDVIFICVGTPSNPDGSANLSYIKQVAKEIGQHMNEYKLIVNKSTVPVGTQKKVTEWIRDSQEEEHPFDVASNPEFLREGNALEDALYPDRVIFGTESKKAANMLKEIYKPMSCPVMVTEPKTAELIKYAANAFLATKISYMNELARLCDKIDVSVIDVARGIGLDRRIGPNFLQAGIGYGGSCFPKDVSALLQTAHEHGMDYTILEKVVYVNNTQYVYFLDQIRKSLGDFKDKRVAIIGISFKPDTDDTREAPSLYLIKSLLEEHAYVRFHDPVANVSIDPFPKRLKKCDTPEQAIKKADAVILCTEWPQYKKIDWSQMKEIMNNPLIFDGRNMLDAEQMKSLGFKYRGIGYR